MRRREFITLLGGAAVTWPVAAHAQRSESVRRIGVLMADAEGLPESQARKAALEKTLEQLRWQIGRTLAVDYRWAVGDLDRARAATAELLKPNPDLILATATPATRAAQQATRSIPIVFVAVSEPVAQGFIASLARPGGNLTGFSNLEPTFGAKWLELLKELAPRATHAAILFNPETSPFAVPFARGAEAAAPTLGLKAETIAIRGPVEIEAAIVRVAMEPGGALIFPPDTHTANHAKLIFDLCERHRLPAVYGVKSLVQNGGLASYGADHVDLFRRAAGYVDRILKGEKPADLAVQQPTKYELLVNLKTAKAIGIAVPPSLLARADEVID